MTTMQECRGKVSIIIPVYNVAGYLDRCVDSVLKQGYGNLEVLLIDDGSTDGSGDICDRFACGDNRIHVIHNTNLGVSTARNCGLEKATGDFISFVDADDCVEANYISSLVNTICDYHAQLAIVDYYIETSERKSTFSLNDDSVSVLSREDALNGIYQKNSYMGYLWNKIFLHSIISQQNLRFYSNVRIWEDLLFCCQYLDCIRTVAYYHRARYVYCWRNNSAVNCETSKKEKSKLTALEGLYQIAAKYSGSFNVYTRYEYANMLIAAYSSGYMGLDSFNSSIVKNIISKVDSLNTKMTFKHTLFYILMKRIPQLAYFLAKEHCQRLAEER